MKGYLPIDKRWNYHLVVWPIVLFITLFIIWASVSDVDEIVHGEGKVIPSSQKKLLQHLEGGIIEEIYVSEGVQVKKGDPIYRLKNSTTEHDNQEKEISLKALRLKQLRLQGQIDFVPKLEFIELTSQSSREMDIFQSEMKNYQEQKSILQDTLNNYRLEKKQKNNQLLNLQAELKIEKENLAILDKLLQKGAASKQQYLHQLAKNQSLITKISEIQNSIPMIVQNIKSAMTKIKKLKSEKQSTWLKELNEVNTQIDMLTQKNLASKDREVRKIITSPVNGIVQKLYFHTIGGIVKASDRVAEITPVDDTLIIEAKIKSSDRGNIQIGQSVSIGITAYSYTRYGLLNGKLISISPDSFVDEQGAHYYQVHVKADHYAFAPNKPILPGMMANINIKTGKKTIMTYLLKPLKDIQKNALTEQ